MERNEKLQTQQTKAFKGGVAMTAEHAYYPDDRELWWSSRLGIVSLCVYDYDEERAEVEGLVELVPVVKIYEKCDCYELFGSVQHNNGGHYHRIVRVFRVTPEVWVVSYEDTREIFYASESRFAVVSINGEPVGKVVLKEGEWCELLRKDEAEKLISAYSEDENYTVYYTYAEEANQ